VPLAVGIDVAKELHWVCVLDMATGGQLQSRKVPNTPEAIDGLIVELSRLSTEHGPVTVGIDGLGGIAGLLTAMLLDPEHGVDLQVVHVPGLLVTKQNISFWTSLPMCGIIRTWQRRVAEHSRKNGFMRSD
jgi:hypothetical protein